MGYFRNAEIIHGRIRTEFNTVRSEFFKVLGYVKSLYGAESEHIDGRWFWWVADSDRNRTVLKSLNFSISELEDNSELPGVSHRLRDYQKTGVRFADRYSGSILLGDDMGLGKSCQALSYVSLRKTYPLLIVCPASVKLNWEREYHMWCNGEKSVTILSGRTPYLAGGDVWIINYDILTFWKDTIIRMNPVQIIADEVQYIKRTQGSEAKRTRAFRAVCRNRPLIALSGTPIENRPYEFFNILNILRSDMFPSPHRFGSRFCAPERNRFSGYMEYKGATNLGELNALLRSIMIRRKKEDVLTELPPKQRIPIPMDVEAKYRKEYSEVEKLLNSAVRKRTGKDTMNILSVIEQLKQLSVKMKMKAVIKWITDYLENNGKLVVFGTHRETVTSLMTAFPGMAVKIDGSVTGKGRQAAVDAFQEDPKIRLLVGNLQAAGVGLTLTAANATAHLEFAWSPTAHTQGEDRVHRLGQTADAVFAYYLIAEGSIDTDLLEIINAKQKIVDATMDGTEAAETPMFNMLMNRLEKSQRKVRVGS